MHSSHPQILHGPATNQQCGGISKTQSCVSFHGQIPHRAQCPDSDGTFSQETPKLETGGTVIDSEQDGEASARIHSPATRLLPWSHPPSITSRMARTANRRASQETQKLETGGTVIDTEASARIHSPASRLLPWSHPPFIIACMAGAARHQGWASGASTEYPGRHDTTKSKTPE